MKVKVKVAIAAMLTACGPTDPDDTLDVLCMEQCMRDGAQLGKTQADCADECYGEQPANDPTNDPNDKEEE